MDDGTIMCKLLRVLDEESIVETAINTTKDMDIFQKMQNLNMGIATAKNKGLKLPGVGA